MRYALFIVALLVPLIATVPALNVTAQDSSLPDLLPTAHDIGPDFVVVDNRTRTLAEQAMGFSNAEEARRLLANWNWQENAFAVFQAAALTSAGAPVGTVDISLTRFADPQSASLAMPYFVQDRAAVLGQHEVQDVSERSIGDDMRALNGPVAQGDDTTIFVRSEALLIRISATSFSGGSITSPEDIAQGIISRSTRQSPSTTVLQAVVDELPKTLPLDHAACFRINGEGSLDIPAVMERLASGSDAAATLTSFGWQRSTYRQFSCKPPVGRVGWVDISLHHFADARGAVEAVSYFAKSRAQSMDLQPVAAIDLGESVSALAGPAINGTEYSLYVSSGARLYAITGVAPDSGSDPRADVEAIAAALLIQNDPVLVAEVPTATAFAPVEVPPTVAPIPTDTPLPTLIPVAIPTSTPVPPATAPPTAIPPPSVVLPTATSIPTPPSPPPTALPTPEATAMPTTVSSTATMTAQPTPTPRLIRPPTPGAG